MSKPLFTAAALMVLTGLAYGQQVPSTFPISPDDSGMGQTQNVNCSDPSQASSSQCASSQSGNFPAMSGAGGNGLNANANATSQQGRVSTYNDLESQQNARRTGYELRPEPLTEFQKFVASTTGEVLPIYGASLFQYVPSTFAPVDNSPVPADYILGPEDELRVRVWGQVNFNANLKVDRSGDIFLPQVGAVHVAGLRFSDIDQHLREAVGKIYRNFQLSVELGQIRSIQVYVTGEARRPGLYTISSLSTLVDAIFASGGPSVRGSMRHIELRRGGNQVTDLDLYALLIHGDKSKDAKLQAEDVIYIPAVGPQAAVVGSVTRPAIYELIASDTVESVLAEAGGLSELATERHASLDRTVDHSDRAAMDIKLDAQGMATPMRGGDILHVQSLVSRYQKTVTLRGNTANPGRFTWHPGMRLSDLFPDRESLITRDYWWKRVQMGLAAPEFQPIQALSTLTQPANPINLRDPNALRMGQSAPYQNENTMQPNLNGQSTLPNGPPATGYQSMSSENPYPESDAFSTQQPIDNGQPQVSGQYQNQMQGQPQSGYPNQNQPGMYPMGQQNQPPATVQSALGASDDGMLRESLTPHPSPRTVVKLPVPEIDWSYAVIERMDPETLKTRLLPFDLGKLVMDHDPSQDLALEPGDVVSVFSQSDIHVPLADQTKFVRLEGEFQHSGTYSAQPGETLRSLVKRAGGLTSNAYLYGSVFTRESTRILQQRRIDEMIQQMVLQMQRGNLALSANPVSTSQDLASVQAAETSERELIAQLRQIRATGRIVFEFLPSTAGADSVPDIPLENGDTFLVPSVPSTVNVLGAVFNQNAFIYRRNAQVRSFLRLAGGPNSDADQRREFVIRGNGSVVSRTMINGTWGNEFLHLTLYPGDTVIVPDKSIKPSALRGLLDWSQVFSQLAFGAAAIEVLK